MMPNIVEKAEDQRQPAPGHRESYRHHFPMKI